MISGNWPRNFPWSLALAGALLIICGCVANARCDEFTGRHYASQQVVWSLLAIVAMLAAAIPGSRRLWQWSYAVYGVTLLLLVAVYAFPPLNNAHRWIRLGPLGLQPSEPAKVALVLALARWLAYRDDHRRLRGLIVPLLLAAVPAALILKEPDLGTATLFIPVTLLMLYVAGARRGDLARLMLIGLLLAPALWVQMSGEQKSRVTALFQQAAAGEKPGDDGYQLYQAKQMLALGGAWGSVLAGPSANDPAVYYLPEARSDFIFCVLGERFGLWGIAMVLALFGLLIARGLAVAREAQDPFGRLLAAGLIALLGLQAIVNSGMNVGLLPVTGVSLPLVSYGGSGLVTYGVALGLVANVGKAES